MLYSSSPKCADQSYLVPHPVDSVAGVFTLALSSKTASVCEVLDFIYLMLLVTSD